MTTVVVGVSASSGSPGALLAAAAEARWRGAELIAVQAWHPPRPPAAPGGHPPGITRDAQAIHNQSERLLRMQVARTLGEKTEVTCKLVQGSAHSVLTKEAAAAVLLVIGAPGTANSLSPLLTRSLTSKLKCPILIMPQAESDPAGATLRDAAE